MKWSFFWILLINFSLTSASPLRSLFTYINNGNEGAIRTLLKTPIDITGVRGNQTALTVALRSLGDEMLDLEKLKAANVGQYVDLIKPGVSTTGATYLFGNPSNEDFFEVTEENKKEVEPRKMTIPISTDDTDNDNDSFKLHDIKFVETSCTIETKINKQSLDPLKKRLLLFLSYSPYIIGGVWLLPSLWYNLRTAHKNVSRYSALKKQEKKVHQHYRIVQSLLHHTTSRMPKKQEESSLAIIKEFQTQVHLRVHQRMLFDLEQIVYDMQESV